MFDTFDKILIRSLRILGAVVIAYAAYWLAQPIFSMFNTPLIQITLGNVIEILVRCLSAYLLSVIGLMLAFEKS